MTGAFLWILRNPKLCKDQLSKELQLLVFVLYLNRWLESSFCWLCNMHQICRWDPNIKKKLFYSGLEGLLYDILLRQIYQIWSICQKYQIWSVIYFHIYKTQSSRGSPLKNSSEKLCKKHYISWFNCVFPLGDA